MQRRAHQPEGVCAGGEGQDVLAVQKQGAFDLRAGPPRPACGLHLRTPPHRAGRDRALLPFHTEAVRCCFRAHFFIDTTVVNRPERA